MVLPSNISDHIIFMLCGYCCLRLLRYGHFKHQVRSISKIKLKIPLARKQVFEWKTTQKSGFVGGELCIQYGEAGVQIRSRESLKKSLHKYMMFPRFFPLFHSTAPFHLRDRSTVSEKPFKWKYFQINLKFPPEVPICLYFGREAC